MADQVQVLVRWNETAHYEAKVSMTMAEYEAYSRRLDAGGTDAMVAYEEFLNKYELHGTEADWWQDDAAFDVFEVMP